MGGMIPYFAGRIGPGLDQLGVRTDDEDLTVHLTRLKKRQESFGATEVEKGFRDFLMSEEALARLDALRASVAALKRLDATAPARRAAPPAPSAATLPLAQPSAPSAK